MTTIILFVDAVTKACVAVNGHIVASSYGGSNKSALHSMGGELAESLGLVCIYQTFPRSVRSLEDLVAEGMREILAHPLQLSVKHAADAASEGWKLTDDLQIVSNGNGKFVDDVDEAAWLHVIKAREQSGSAADMALRTLVVHAPDHYREICDFVSGPLAETVAKLQRKHEAEIRRAPTDVVTQVDESLSPATSNARILLHAMLRRLLNVYEQRIPRNERPEVWEEVRAITDRNR